MSESVHENGQDEEPGGGLESDDDLASATKPIAENQPDDDAVSQSQVSVRSSSLLDADAEPEPTGGSDADLDSDLESDVELAGLSDDDPDASEEEGAAAERDPDDEELPRMLGERYRLESLLAKGGMGRVYRGTQLPLGRSVAVKVLGSTSGLDAAYRRRFLLEASVCASLTHPNIVVVHDYGETPDGVLFMAMELLEGRRLSQVVMEEGPMPVRRGAFVALQVARALREAHRQGVAHRDLKPGNVFLRTADDEDAPDEVKVFDFGLAKVFQTAEGLRDQELTMDGVMMGSPRYMSPEQIRGEEVDARADIYSFGALLYMVLCGRPPFLGATSIDVLTAHIQQAPPSFAEALLERGHAPPEPISPALEALVMRCLAKDRTKRYQSIDEPILELKRVLRGVVGAQYDEVLSSASFVFSEEETQTLPPSTPPLGALHSSSIPPAMLSPADSADIAAPPVQSAASIAAPPPQEKSRLPYIAIAMLTAIIIGAAVALLMPGEAEPSIEAPAELARVTIASDPPGATVYLDGVRQGVTPFESTYALGTSQTFRFRMPGYEDELVRSEIGEGDVDVSLRALAPPAQILPSAEAGDPEAPRVVGTQPQVERAMQQAPMQQATMRHVPVSQAGMRGPNVTMSARPTTPATMADAVQRPTRVVPLDEPGRGLVDDTSRVPLVD